MLLNTKTTQQQAFFSAVSSDMFSNVAELFEQIDAQFTGRSVDESVGAQMAAFCVYVCGLFSTYLCLYPHCKLTRHIAMSTAQLTESSSVSRPSHHETRSGNGETHKGNSL